MIFFLNITFAHLLSGLYTLLHTSPLMIVAYVGAIQNVLSKSTKYSFFDPTKEMAYIPLDHQTKSTGKAAIEVTEPVTLKGVAADLAGVAGAFIAGV